MYVSKGEAREGWGLEPHSFALALCYIKWGWGRGQQPLQSPGHVRNTYCTPDPLPPESTLDPSPLVIFKSCLGPQFLCFMGTGHKSWCPSVFPPHFWNLPLSRKASPQPTFPFFLSTPTLRTQMNLPTLDVFAFIKSPLLMLPV